ncbi:MAG: DUF3040 domain-containing protein [Nitriliruptoraceae bacterium]
MPLSEHEENVLAEIERQLAAEDPRFATRARRRLNLSRSGQRTFAIVLGVIGVAAILSIGFLPSPWQIVVPGLGFVGLFTAVILGVSSRRASDDTPSFVPPDDRG